MKIRIYPKSLLETVWQQDKLLFTPRGGATTLVSSVWSAAGPQAGHQRPEPLCRCPYLRGVRYG